ncbi:MAG TPA: ATP-binding protein [Gemmatimonadales bacterium]|nr:ATP-binding protein [Gemmatimonadales bacterium]
MADPVTILLVEDSAADVRLFREMLREAEWGEHALVHAGRLADALDRLRHSPADVVLLDLTLPDSQGLETFLRIHQQAPGVPIVLLTGLGSEELGTRAVQLGAQDYLVKGEIDHRLLTRAIRYAIHRKSTERELGRLYREAELAREELQRYAAELERRVAERTAELRDSYERMEQFSYAVSHDLRAPLRAIRGYTEALREDFGDELPEPGREYIRRIVKATDYMSQLCEDLLQLAHLRGGELEIEPVSLVTVVRDATGHLTEVVRAAGARLDVALDQVPPVLGSRPSLVQAVTNLLSNAIKFVPAGVPPRVRVWAESREHAVRLWIEDNGIGIEPHHQERIFRGFQRLHSQDRYPGSGVGLAIVRRTVERLNGRVGVESTPGEGSRFWIELPRPLAPDPPGAPGEPASGR